MLCVNCWQFYILWVAFYGECVYPMHGRRMYCMSSSVCMARGLCSQRNGSIINYSLAGNTLVLISNNKICWHNSWMQKQNTYLLHFWSIQSTHIRPKRWTYSMALNTVIKHNGPLPPVVLMHITFTLCSVFSVFEFFECTALTTYLFLRVSQSLRVSFKGTVSPN